MKTVYIESYGCFANQDNESIMKGLLVKEGFKITNKESKADIIIINTCVVKGSTSSKMISRIRYFKDRNLIISGCMPESEAKLCKKLAPNASLINTFHITDTIKAVKSLLNKKPIDLLGKRKEILLDLPKIENKRVIIQISQGCNSYCSFCETKLAKGVLISFPKEKIIKEIKNKIKSGHKIINLTATDTGCYGLDIKTDLPSLLKSIIKLKGNFKIKIGMMNPEHVIKYLDELIEIYKDNKIIKFIHIPLQSGSDKVLKEMNRSYTIKQYKTIVNKFRKKIFNVHIITDLIVGYPLETEKDFKETLKIVKELKFNVINISKFSPRPGTKASKLKQLTSQEIKKRSVLLHNLLHNLHKNRLITKIKIG